jgi:hypothetical protein
MDAQFSEKTIERLYRKCPYLISRKYDPKHLFTLRSQYRTTCGRYSKKVGFVDILVQPRSLVLHIVELKVTPLIVADLTDQLLEYIKCLRQVPEFAENHFKGILVGKAPKTGADLAAAVAKARGNGFDVSLKILRRTVPEPDQVAVCPVCTSHYFARKIKKRRDRYRCRDECFIQSSGNLKQYEG